MLMTGFAYTATNIMDLLPLTSKLVDEQERDDNVLSSSRAKLAYVCKHCFKIYLAKISLKYHIKYLHANELPPKIIIMGRPPLVKRGRRKKSEKIDYEHRKKISIPYHLICDLQKVVYELYYAHIIHPLFCKLVEMQEPRNCKEMKCDAILAEYLLYVADTQKRDKLKAKIRWVILFREGIMKAAWEKKDGDAVLKQINEVYPMGCGKILTEKETEENIGLFNSWLIENSYGSLEGFINHL